MFIVVEHEVTNPEKFWRAAQEATTNLPSGLKLHQVMPNTEGTRATCVWEAQQVDEVKNFIESKAGGTANNTYYAVEEQNAMGLPGGAQAAQAK